ncbi:MAG: hypothetical protein KAX05_01445, partial [Bacteroidales bacterium]|nr:hypothetical protein [Bacteroidales bacterium]
LSPDGYRGDLMNEVSKFRYKNIKELLKKKNYYTENHREVTEIHGEVDFLCVTLCILRVTP